MEMLRNSSHNSQNSGAADPSGEFCELCDRFRVTGMLGRQELRVGPHDPGEGRQLVDGSRRTLRPDLGVTSPPRV